MKAVLKAFYEVQHSNTKTSYMRTLLMEGVVSGHMVFLFIVECMIDEKVLNGDVGSVPRWIFAFSAVDFLKLKHILFNT